MEYLAIDLVEGSPRFVFAPRTARSSMSGGVGPARYLRIW